MAKEYLSLIEKGNDLLWLKENPQWALVEYYPEWAHHVGVYHLKDKSGRECRTLFDLRAKEIHLLKVQK